MNIVFLICVSVAGCVLGRVAAGWASASLFDMNDGGLLRCSGCRTQRAGVDLYLKPRPQCQCGQAAAMWPVLSAATLAALFALFAWLLTGDLRCQNVVEVQPSAAMWYGRLAFHLTLIFLLWTATLTDLLDYVISDYVIWTGIVIAVVAAFVTGELQTIHIWVNWDEAVEGLRGPYLPDWIKHHQHLHGLAWSLAGMLAGAVSTWLVRAIASLVLGYPALGLGDVTLMAMIGAFVGWQPVLCVLAIAPLASIVLGLTVRILTGRTFVAFGPHLAFSAVVVICSWRWLWADVLKLRTIFSHWPTVLGMLAASYVTMIVLLSLVRVYRSVPARRA